MLTPKMRIAISLIAIPALFGLTIPAMAKTFNPIALINDGGNTINAGQSLSTFLYVDVSERNSVKKFWVRVEKNQGTPRTDPQEQGNTPTALPTLVSIKYFPLSRFYEVLSSMRRIETFGIVNPYIGGGVICDGPDSSIRYYKETLTMAYDCGADAPEADAATFQSEDLLKALRAETVSDPDMSMSHP